MGTTPEQPLVVLKWRLMFCILDSCWFSPSSSLRYVVIFTSRAA